jgi:hypothetical protein
MATPNLTSITSVIPKVLASAQIASGDNTVYTVGASKAAKLAKLVVANVSASAVVVSVSIVPSGGTVDGTHKIMSASSLAAGDSTVITEAENIWLGAGDFISVNASAATSVNVLASGLEFS